MLADYYDLEGCRDLLTSSCASSSPILEKRGTWNVGWQNPLALPWTFEDSVAAAGVVWKVEGWIRDREYTTGAHLQADARSGRRWVPRETYVLSDRCTIGLQELYSLCSGSADDHYFGCIAVSRETKAWPVSRETGCGWLTNVHRQ
jgi:hypothetical protein